MYIYNMYIICKYIIYIYVYIYIYTELKFFWIYIENWPDYNLIPPPFANSGNALQIELLTAMRFAWTQSYSAGSKDHEAYKQSSNQLQ